MGLIMRKIRGFSAVIGSCNKKKVRWKNWELALSFFILEI